MNFEPKPPQLYQLLSPI
ncbi:unnamed protein product [Linum tenue]|uniref:Uncharacterized protein n=1 Tax=Linum tenue TaxID=586396 RepID=A0AAV0Q3S7_9ROSI|nr:unnamed protein product [Linum tenue]